jgi:hypothetical protein
MPVYQGFARCPPVLVQIGRELIGSQRVADHNFWSQGLANIGSWRDLADHDRGRAIRS